MGELKDACQLLYDAEGPSARKVVTDDIMKRLREDDTLLVEPVNNRTIQPGGLYFVMYNIGSKLSAMESFVPMLCADRRRIGSTEFIYGISMSFIPASVRILFFDKVINNYKALALEATKAGGASKEDYITDIDYDGAYSALASIGFEYSIRKMESALVTKTYAISAALLPSMMLLDTYRFTSVDEGKMAQIWKAKISQQEARRAKIIKETLDDFAKMGKEINADIENAIDRNDRAFKMLQRLSLNSKNKV